MEKGLPLARQALGDLVGRAGFEPATNGLKVELCRSSVRLIHVEPGPGKPCSINDLAIIWRVGMLNGVPENWCTVATWWLHGGYMDRNPHGQDFQGYRR
jgi:hypothetical protein